MNILKPDLLWVENRCYRAIDSTSTAQFYHEPDLYENDIMFANDEVDNEEENLNVEQLDNSKYRISIHVPQPYLGSVIGKKGATRFRIERDTKTEIKIPKQGLSGDVVILGSTPANVKAAGRRINIIVMSSRMKQKPTHFISIPMNSPVIMDNFQKFKEQVLSANNNHQGFDESLFINPFKLHLTLGVMCLMDNEERLLASKLLTEAKNKIIFPSESIKIRIKGLAYMNDDPSAINVLYGKIEEQNATPGTIQKLADDLVEYFIKSGFMEKEFNREHVNLHVTLLNSKYKNRSSTAGNEDSKYRNKRKTRETFDGSWILEQFGDFDFGVTELKDIHLSQFHTMGPDGYYQSTCVVSCIT